jgi:hypothetical protein
MVRGYIFLHRSLEMVIHFDGDLKFSYKKINNIWTYMKTVYVCIFVNILKLSVTRLLKKSLLNVSSFNAFVC